MTLSIDQIVDQAVRGGLCAEAIVYGLENYAASYRFGIENAEFMMRQPVQPVQ